MYILPQIFKKCQSLDLVALIPIILLGTLPPAPPNRYPQAHVANKEMCHADRWSQHPEQVTRLQDVYSFNHKEKPASNSAATSPQRAQSNANT